MSEPRPYDMTKREDRERWFREMKGYMARANEGKGFVTDGTDKEGRQYVVDGFSQLRDLLVPIRNELPPQDPLNSCPLRDTCDACFYMDVSRCPKYLEKYSDEINKPKVYGLKCPNCDYNGTNFVEGQAPTEKPDHFKCSQCGHEGDIKEFLPEVQSPDKTDIGGKPDEKS